MQQYAIITDFFRRERRQVSQILWLNFGANVCALLLPLLISQMYANLLDFNSARARVLSQLTPQYELVFQHFPLLFAVFTAVLALRFFLDYRRKTRQVRLGETFQSDLRARLFEHHLGMDTSVYDTKGVGRFLLRFSGELSAVQAFWTKGILQFLADLLLLFLGLGLIVYLQPAIGAMVLLVLSASFLLFQTINKRTGNVERKRRSRKAQLLAFFNARLLAVSTIQAHNRETIEIQKFEKLSNRVEAANNRYGLLQALSEAAVPTALYLTMALVLVFMYVNKNEGWEPSQATRLLAIILIMLSWRAALMRLFQVALIWEKGKLSLASLNRFFEHQRAKSGEIKEKRLKPVVLNIENVAFASKQIPAQKPVSTTVQKHDLRILESQHTHQWVKILACMVPYTEGVISLDESNIAEQNPRSVRRNLAFSSPTFPLYGKNILEVIATSTREEERQRAKELFSQWRNLFPALQDTHFDAPFHENGGTLSATQLQLLRLLRALLTRKPFLILEEPFAHLDADSASKVWELIVEERKKRGVLILTNRASLYAVRIAQSV